MEQSTGLIVIGMHRSGTSALTGALHALGANAGEMTELTGSNVENQKGFFERRDLRNICDALLHGADADWWNVSDFETGRIQKDIVDQQRLAFTQTINVLSQSTTWIVKEPRLCLLLPLLIDLVANPVCLFIYRNPIEVAKSLRARNRISLQQGVSLWEKYNGDALEATKHVPRIFVSYGALVSDPLHTLESLVEQLAERGVDGLESPRNAPDFIDGSLQRSISEPEEMEILTDQQWALWKWLEQKSEFNEAFVHQHSKGQKYVLEDLEHQFRNNNAVETGAPSDAINRPIRSRKVRQIARLLDQLAISIASKNNW